jgi:hypothetical protein
MPDRVAEVLTAALKQALLDHPAEHRLYRSGKLEGLFPGRGGAGGEAAARALREGLFEGVRTEVKGKTTIEWVRLTPRGVEFVHEQESPAAALRELRETLAANREGVPAWLAEMRASLQALDARLAADARKWLQRLESLERRVDQTLRRLEEATPLLPPDVAEAHPWAVDALNYLDRRRDGGAPGDCPLPELFAALTAPHPGLSVGAFHEGLRRLHGRRALQLRPAADPADLARPEYALFDGDAVFYFARR